MTPQNVVRLLASFAVLALAVPGKASAQATATPEVYSACYIPLLGVVYRIKAPSLPTACLSKTHVEFSWNQVGPKGDRGEKGDPGVAGNLALAGQGCPTGFLVSGFSSTGQVVCKNLAGQGPADPPPPISYEGFWTLSPAPSTKCGPFDVVTFTVSSASTRLGSSGILTFTVRGNFDGGIFGNTPFEAAIDLSLDQTTNIFSGNGTFTSPGQASFAATVNGQFRSSTSFTASVDISGSITSIPAGDCHPIHAVVTATRSS
jgi:hypothetical protein